MKYLLLVFFSFISFQSFALEKISESEKQERFIKIWGLLKYKHPVISKGKYDYNAEFLNEIRKQENITGIDQFNEEMYNWISKFSKGAKYKTKQKVPSSGTVTAADVAYEWIDNSGFSAQLADELNRIKKNTAIGDYYVRLSTSRYPDFRYDYALPGFDFSQKPHRLLLLGSFWNAMNYWNVNITVTDVPWSRTLKDMIPIFTATLDKTAFELAKEKLIASLNDSHSDYSYSYSINNLMQKKPLFGGKIVNDSLVVTFSRVTPVANDNDIEPGDVIFAADGKPLKEYYLNKFNDVISASNAGYIARRVEKYLLFADNRDSVAVGVLKKNGTVRNQYIRLYNDKDLPKQYSVLKENNLQGWYSVKDGIGYVNLYRLKHGDLKKAFADFKDNKAIILDLRNYTYLTENIADYLYAEEKQFIKLLLPYTPGYGIYDAKPKLRMFGNPFKAGRDNKDHYKGKIILLVDRQTASYTEFLGMEIQQAPHCITIGEQTFGAPMNRKSVLLADGTTVDYTYAATFYPDDTPVQRHGLKIDVPVKERARNYHPDLYIEEAIKVIENKNG